MSASEALHIAIFAALDQRLGSRHAVLMQHLLQRVQAGFVVQNFKRHRIWTSTKKELATKARRTQREYRKESVFVSFVSFVPSWRTFFRLNILRTEYRRVDKCWLGGIMILTFHSP